MRALLIATSLSIGLVFTAVVHAQVPAGAPAGTTGLCKDGSYSSADTKRGACRGHKGVKEWYATDGATATPAAKSSTSAAAPASAARTTATATPGAAPTGSTGLCKDGTYTDTPTKRGACRGHKGVQDWYAAATAASPATLPAAKPAPVTPVAPPVAAPKTTAPAANPASRASEKNETLPATPAAGGGPGKVWVNTSTKVYHCPSDRYYGKTKEGEYMSEADALAKGNHASHGKACSS